MTRRDLTSDPQPDSHAPLIKASRAARERAAATRAHALGNRFNVHRQRLHRNQILEKYNTTIHQAREMRTASRRSCHFGLDWQEPEESLDAVLLVHEPSSLHAS